MALGIIPRDFPRIGAARIKSNEIAGISETSEGNEEICSCPKRCPPPGKPSQLPFTPIPENIPKFEAWCKETYAASTFNQCPHQNLPEMGGPPLKIHVDPDAKPVACLKPGFIPLNLYDHVIADIKKDITLGVCQWPPYNEPVTWCHRMVINTKSDGSPRRTIDMSPLNRVCKREPHGGKSPFQMARAIPRDTWKTVQDAWNGYHSVPIRAEDRHLTTFMTPIGRVQYARAPQGALCSGDAYNQRFATILADFTDKERCVDDTVFWDDDKDLERHWWRNIEFLELCGRNGVILNPLKFQCCLKAIAFAGFKVTASTVEPLPKFLDSIRNFPRPTKLIDIRGWFGLINQAAHYAQLRDIVEPMRHFQRKNARFEWNAELEKSFQLSKEKIIEAIKEGVEIFDKGRLTCLPTDWSKLGIGYYLMQKHCECSSDVPGECCDSGWRITLAGSRPLKSAETRYAPVEGEALAVVWSLDQTRYFTQGCDNLIVLTDHKPLCKLFGDRSLDQIQNPRLMRLKEKTMRWCFDIKHRPGKDHHFADATSRNPMQDCDIEEEEIDEDSVGQISFLTASCIEDDDEDDEETTYVNSVVRRNVDKMKIRAVTWERIKSETRQDADMRELTDIVLKGFPEKRQDMPPRLRDYWEYRDSIYSVDDVLMVKYRLLIPQILRQEILESLHAAHQCVVSMTSRAQTNFIWPGISLDIQETRDLCSTCNNNAPSNPRHEPEEPRIPSMPFESVCMDFFKLEGWQYLVMVDRLSGWSEVRRAKVGTDTAGSKGVITAMREVFGTFGVPREISTDGEGPFTADETRDFYDRWGIKFTLSSAHHPISNGRAELGVKSMKRLLHDNLGPGGSLDTDKFLRAILIHRNTPDQLSKRSPSEVLFGHTLRDALPMFEGTQSVFENDKVLPLWREAWSLKERALRKRAARTVESLSKHSRDLPPLRHGDQVFVQNQTGNHPTKWDRTGVIMECRPHNQYTVKVDVTGRLTLRNRQFLRKYNPSQRNVLLGVPSQSVPSSDRLPVEEVVEEPTEEKGPQDSSLPIATEDIALPSYASENSSDASAGEDPQPNSAEPSVRRSNRSIRPTLVYDPTSGKYVPRTT